MHSQTTKQISLENFMKWGDLGCTDGSRILKSISRSSGRKGKTAYSTGQYFWRKWWRSSATEHTINYVITQAWFTCSVKVSVTCSNNINGCNRWEDRFRSNPEAINLNQMTVDANMSDKMQKFLFL
jgi:hypothetical protein